MWYLLAASVLWACSFGLIRHNLAGMDPALLAWVRLGVASLAFAPFLRPGDIGAPLRLRLLLTGVVQYGVMYLTYTTAFQVLQAHEVALFTVLTPVYVVLIRAVCDGRRYARFFVAAALAVAGAALIVAGGADVRGTLEGFLLVQCSNVCFALGQVYYPALMRTLGQGRRDREVFALLYMGGAALAMVPLAANAAYVEWSVTGAQALTLLYLGLAPSALGFFLWNVGATRAGPGTLAVMNNAKVPLAVAASLLVFGETADLRRLLAGGAALLAGVLLSERAMARKERKGKA